MGTKTVRLPKAGPALSKMHSIPAALAAQEAFNNEVLQTFRGLPIKTHAPRHPTGTAASEGTEDAFLRVDSVTKQGIVTIKGDILGHNATMPAAVPVGTVGQLLSADPTQATGLKYIDPGAVVDAIRAFLAHVSHIPKVQAGAGITIVENALGPIVSSAGGAPEDGNSIDAHRAFLSHPPRDRQVRAGANVTVTEDALGYIVASTGGGSAVDDQNNILANQVFGF